MGGGSFLARLLDEDRAGAVANRLTDIQLAAQANTFTLAVRVPQPVCVGMGCVFAIRKCDFNPSLLPKPTPLRW